MGSSSSKAARTAASAAKRKYPQQASPATTNTPPRPPPPGGPASAPGPTVRPPPQASETRDDSINHDASDPQFAASLRSLGPVQPSSTLSNSSHFPSAPSPAPPTGPSNPQQRVFPDPSQNPAVLVLTAREQLAKEAEAEFARARYEGGGGRKFIDVMKLRQVLVMRDEKHMADADIEKKLGLASGLVKKLGARGIVSEVGTGAG